MKIKTLTLADKPYPPKLAAVSAPPKRLFYLSDNLQDLLELPALAVIGSRKATPYGRSVTQKLAGELAAKGVVIVSGLAIGIDAIAHQAALDSGGKTIAVLPCGLDKIYPSSHRQLAKQILQRGGALITEYPANTEPFKNNFIARNRIVSGISSGVLITEAAEKSGTLHTANFALEQGREVMAVPGNITSLFSSGTNRLIKAGATLVASANDVLEALGIQPIAKQQELIAATREEAILLQLIREGVTDGEELLRQSRLDAAIFNQTLTMLEITSKIRSGGANAWHLA